MDSCCNERRAALIAALIAIPAAILIAMLVHHFVPVPMKTPAGNSTPARPPMGGGFAAPMNPGQMTEPEDLTPVYEKRVQLAATIYQYAAELQKKGSFSAEDMIPLEVNCRLAEGALYRYVNKVRTRGVSLSDTAVRYDGAVRVVSSLKKQYEAGKETLASVAEKTDLMLELEIQLVGNRNFNDEKWQDAYQDYRETPNAENYQKMLEAEKEIQPFRRF